MARVYDDVTASSLIAKPVSTNLKVICQNIIYSECDWEKIHELC